MKKRMLSLLIALCMALSLMPVTAFADDGTSILPGEVGGVISLTEDVSITEDVSLDLTGKTINTNGHTIMVRSGVVSITGGTFVNDVTGKRGKDPHCILHVSAGAKLVIDGSVLESAGYQLLDVAGECWIKSASLECTVACDTFDSCSMVAVYGESAKLTMLAGSIYMKDTTDPSSGMYGIYASEGATVVLGSEATHEGPTIESQFAAVGMNHDTSPASLTINGGSYTSLAKANDEWWKYFCGVLYLPGEGTATINGGEFHGGSYAISMPWADADLTLTINGGSFDTNDGDGILYYRSNLAGDAESTAAKTVINDGEFDGTLVCGDRETKPLEVKGGYFNDLASAIAYAADNAAVKVLSDVKTNVTVPAGKTVVLDLNGKTINGQVKSAGNLTILDSTADKEPAVNDDFTVGTYESGKITYSNTAINAIDGGTITIQNGMIESTGNIGVYATGDYSAANEVGSTVTVNGGYILAQEFAASAQGKGAILNVNGGVLVAKDNAAVAGNGNHVTGKMYGDVDINITGGTIISHIKTPGYTACGVYLPGGRSLNISGGTIYAENGSGVCVRAGIANITGGEIIATGSEDGWVGDSKNIIGSGITYDKLANYPYSTENDVINISGNVKISGSLNILKSADSADTPKYISISGGYFTEDPSEYCVEGKTGVASDDANYPYTVGAKNNKAKPAEVEAVIVPADVAEGASEAAKNAAAAMDGAHVEQNNNLEAAVKNEANNNDITPNTSIKTDNGIKSVTEVLMKLDGNSGIKEKDVVIVYQPYIDVKVADAKTGGADTPKYTELTVEMTPMYRVIATTKAVYENENVDYYTDGDKQNAIIVEEAKELDLADKEYDVTVFLPDDFATDGDKLSVKHEKDNGSVEYYTGTYYHPSSSAYVQFTTKGFSPFTIYAASESAAEVDGVIYPSLQAAVDAVKNNGTIKLLKDVAADEKATVSKTITFNVDPDNHAFDSEKNLVAGNRTTVTSEKLPNGVYSFKFTYTPSSGSGSTSSYYTVTVASTKNGTVSASTKSAAKDEVVTVTVKADNGYELDKLTITDANGNELKLTDKGDGKYTFVMPKSKVTVTATFALADENPIFDDIDKDAYYYDAIKWAVANGVTNGMSTTEFVPDGPCTRGQIVTFLWRAAGKPAPTTTNNPFVDVNEKDYYYEAVLWAVENGITNGMSETEFMPELTCTRAHGVTFLYRAMGKAVDAKAEFSDVPADAYYAQAVAWAAANGVTNGVSEELFAPDNACTRVQIVTFLYRANFIK